MYKIVPISDIFIDTLLFLNDSQTKKFKFHFMFFVNHDNMHFLKCNYSVCLNLPEYLLFRLEPRIYAYLSFLRLVCAKKYDY